MIVDVPILLPETLDLISPSPNCVCPVQQCQPRLVAWRVSGKVSDQRQFQKMLPSLSFSLGGTQQTPTITLPGGSGMHGVQRRSCLPFCQMYQLCRVFLADEFEASSPKIVYRSAFSSTLLPIEGFPVGQHPLVIRLFKGVFSLSLDTPIPGTYLGY